MTLSGVPVVASQEHLRHPVSPGRFAFCSAPLPDLRTMARMPRATIRSFRPVFDALSLLILLQNLNQNLALARRPRLPMLPSGQRVHSCGALWPRRASSAPCSPCAMVADRGKAACW